MGTSFALGGIPNPCQCIFVWVALVVLAQCLRFHFGGTLGEYDQ